MSRASALREGRVDSFAMVPNRVHEALSVIEGETAVLMAEQQRKAEQRRKRSNLRR